MKVKGKIVTKGSHQNVCCSLSVSECVELGNF